MFPPELDELTPCLYSSKSLAARENFANRQIRLLCGDWLKEAYFYFMKRVSRNWSRPMKDFMVR